MERARCGARWHRAAIAWVLRSRRIPPDPKCGSHVWIPSVDPKCGSQVWIRCSHARRNGSAAPPPAPLPSLCGSATCGGRRQTQGDASLRAASRRRGPTSDRAQTRGTPETGDGEWDPTCEVWDRSGIRRARRGIGAGSDVRCGSERDPTCGMGSDVRCGIGIGAVMGWGGGSGIRRAVWDQAGCTCRSLPSTSSAELNSILHWYMAAISFLNIHGQWRGIRRWRVAGCRGVGCGSGECVGR